MAQIYSAVDSTHDQVEAMTMADKIVVLNAGRIEQSGPPMELYNFPRTEFVARFIGSPTMNLIGGPLARAQGADLIGVRPEHAMSNILARTRWFTLSWPMQGR